MSSGDLSEQHLTGLADVELLDRVDEIVTRFEELDPLEAGDALGALVQELGERHWPEAILAQLRMLLLERDPESETAVELDAVREGMARRAALRAAVGAGGQPARTSWDARGLASGIGSSASMAASVPPEA